jgi:nicotinic acid mononucleotide adenylyltransferase
MSPPTRGHELVIKTVVETARSSGSHHVVFLSQTQKAPTDPLDWNFKRRVCEAAFKGVNISSDISIKNPFMALEYLEEHYDRIVMVAGSDQVEDYSKFKKYTDVWGVDFEVVSAGERVSESRGIAGVTATKMRQYAADGDRVKFFKGLPQSLNEGLMELVYKNTRRGMKK